MSFISIGFFVFLLATFICYNVIPNRYRWILMLFASYSFYSYWDWRYVPLLLGSSLVDYFCALKMGGENTKSLRKPYLFISLFVNLGVLFSFKYWNFFGHNLNIIFSANFELHNLLLPLGLSFYTLQTLSYTFDVYLGKVRPEKHFGFFCLYVCFFPQLVSGPIERSKYLLPQLKKLSTPTILQFRTGLILILWGLFLKLVISNNLFTLMDSIFYSEHVFSFWVYWFCSVLVTVIVYCDFMAYSEIARGVARIFGVDLSLNFRRPFFAKNLRSFWQRWHISLTRWVGDYIQVPLMRRFPEQPQRSLVGIFALILIGLWHGASWNFILFGLLHGVVLAIWDPVSRFFSRIDYLKRYGGQLSLLIIICIHGPLFYIVDTALLLNTFSKMFSYRIYSLSDDLTHMSGKTMFFTSLFGMCVLFLYSYRVEYLNKCFLSYLSVSRSIVRWLISILFLTTIFLFGGFNSESFIYFEF